MPGERSSWRMAPVRHTLALLALVGCASPLDGYQSSVPLVVVDTHGLEMGRRADSIESSAWARAEVGVYPLDDGGHARVDGTADYLGKGAIHVRGSSSRDYPKVGYRLELRDDSGDDLSASLLGMPAEADWVLSGPYSDKTLIRNHLMYALSRDIGRYAPRTRFVELFLVDNDRPPSTAHYRGIYVLTESIERGPDRVALQELEPEQGQWPEVTGGYMLRRDRFEGGQDTAFRTAVYDDLLVVDEPEPISDAQLAWLREYLRNFEAALAVGGFDPADAPWRQIADVDSFVDHMLLVELGRNVDGYELSTWITKDREGPLSMGPIWDYNGALGNASYHGAWRTAGWHYENRDFPAEKFAWYSRMLEDPVFVARRAERWREHRRGPLADEAVLLRIREARRELAQAAPQNFDRWPVLGRVIWPNDDGARDRKTWEEELAYLEGWVLGRMAWMDGAVAP